MDLALLEFPALSNRFVDSVLHRLIDHLFIIFLARVMQDAVTGLGDRVARRY
jgi:hypothetical protein